MPVIRLKTVVFPAPFGPMTLMIERGGTSMSTSCTAARPPKCFVTLFSFNNGSLVTAVCSTLIVCSCLPLLNTHLRFKAGRTWNNIQRTHLHALFFRMVQFTAPARAGDQSFWAEDHDRHQNDAEEQVSYVFECKARDHLRNHIMNRVDGAGRIGGQRVELRKDQLVDGVDGQRADDYAGDTANSPYYHHGQVDHGVAEVELVRGDAAGLRGEIDPGDAGEKGSGGEGKQFRADEVDPRRGSGNLIFTDGDPGTAQARITQAQIGEDG